MRDEEPGADPVLPWNLARPRRSSWTVWTAQWAWCSAQKGSWSVFGRQWSSRTSRTLPFRRTCSHRISRFIGRRWRSQSGSSMRDRCRTRGTPVFSWSRPWTTCEFQADLRRTFRRRSSRRTRCWSHHPPLLRAQRQASSRRQSISQSTGIFIASLVQGVDGGAYLYNIWRNESDET